jgi:selenocysteine lyase/cysteine desulfurase
MAQLMHKYGGYCFVDFAASAPYIDIDMHPEDESKKIDAIFFSPHKFLGGPGSSGVLIFDSKLYHNKIPDNTGGGTVKWTNPWGQHSFIEDIEAREDGGTPGFLQTIRAALAIKLKDEMGVVNILKREREIVKIAFDEMRKIPNLHILADNIEHRLAIMSFYIDNIHYNLIVKLLNDMFGVQTRGGCSCAGTYGHYLLHVNIDTSNKITSEIESGCLLDKPGWVRASFHPTTTDEEVRYVCDSIKYIVENIEDLAKEYIHDPMTNEFNHKSFVDSDEENIKKWFKI